MKEFTRGMSPGFMSAALSMAIIGSLCFSVGEGLRLTPFPISSLTYNAEPNAFIVKASDSVSLTQYGPLDVPAQTQKRGKRQALELASPGSSDAGKFVSSFCNLLDYEVVDAGSFLFVPRPEGRAPPSFS